MSYFNAQRSGVVYPSSWSTQVNGQMINEVENPHMHTPMYHLNAHMFHSPSNDWLQTPPSDLYGSNAHTLMHQYQQQPHHQLHHAQQQYSQHHQHATPSATTTSLQTLQQEYHQQQQQQQQQQQHQQQQQQQQQQQLHLHSPQQHNNSSSSNRSHIASNLSSPSSNGLTVAAGPTSTSSTRLNETASNHAVNHAVNAMHNNGGGGGGSSSNHLASPPITVSGSEVSSPDAARVNASPLSLAHNLASSRSSPANNNNNNNSSSSNMHNNNNGSLLGINDNNNNNLSGANGNAGSRAVHESAGQVEYDWMRKNTYPAQPVPGKTRTKDKYRVVYNDNQRLELEKEFRTSRYITIRRKAELAQVLSLSERQVKIWFQNRRAKERKQTKKDTNGIRSDMLAAAAAGHRLEADAGYQHSLHAMNHHHQLASMSVRLHPHLPMHSHYAAHTHTHHSHISAAAAVAAANMNVGGSHAAAAAAAAVMQQPNGPLQSM